MIINRKPPRYPRRGPSCLLVLFVTFGIAVSLYVIQNAEEVRLAIVPTPTTTPTRSSTELAVLAELSRDDGANTEAIAFYDEAIQSDPTNVEVYVRSIELLVWENESERAVERAEQATVLAPENDAVWTAAAAAYLAEGDRMNDLGDENAANLQYANAAQAARKATSINPNNATALAYAAGGTILQGDPEKFEQAQLLADDAVRIEPENAIARYYMATVFTYQGRYAEALEQYLRGIEADPNNPDLHIGLAYNYYGTGSIPDALLSFEQAIAVDPNNAEAYDGRAYMYLQLGDAPLAEQNALQATELNPNMARAQGRLGEAYFRQNNYPEAIEALEKAVAMYGRATDLNARFFNMLASAYISQDLNNCPLAAPLFEQVLDATTNELIVAAANEGLVSCRRVQLGTAP
ncbi:tetratricopeptide repeat protein [Promineifilum sp.]|uniref:tetratricopeptide repeat protein n=1 Tax=Promineifilum sp. TaxID=2664178 RepID=UPI0035B17567